MQWKYYDCESLPQNEQNLQKKKLIETKERKQCETQNNNREQAKKGRLFPPQALQIRSGREKKRMVALELRINTDDAVTVAASR